MDMACMHGPSIGTRYIGLSLVKRPIFSLLLCLSIFTPSYDIIIIGENTKEELDEIISKYLSSDNKGILENITFILIG